MAQLFEDSSQKRRSRIAEALFMEGSGTPITHWAQGLDRGMSSVLGALLMNKSDRDEKADRTKLAELLLNAPGLAQPTAPATAPPAAPPAAPTQPPQRNATPFGTLSPESYAELYPQAKPDTAPIYTSPGLPGGNIPPGVGPPPDANAGLHFGLRNNNAMNIMALPGADKAYPGVVGTHTTRPGMDYLKFDTPENGLAAAAQTLRFHAGRGVDTPMKMMSTLAPNVPGHGNNPTSYAAVISKALGVGPNDKVDFSDPAVIAKVLPAIVKVETGTDYKGYTPDMYSAASGTRNVVPAGGEKPDIPPYKPPATSAAAADAIPPQIANYIRQLVATGNPQAMNYATQLYAQYSTPEKPTENMREYEASKRDPALLAFIKDKKAPLVQIDQRGETKFKENVAKNQVERFDKIVQAGTDAKGMIANVQALRDIGSRITTGKTAELKAALGPYAEFLGANIKDLDDLQAYKAIVARIAPQMRVPGSGATSDFEMQKFLEALPGIGKTPGGNELISKTLDAIAQHKIAAAEIASRAMAEEISPREAEKLLRALPDPLTLWKQANGETGTLKNEKPAASPAAPPAKVYKFNPKTGRIE